ncbi:MAG: serine hydroxymethyltransferase, partial [Calditrichaeota bacterium]|nr:serine hydroxymethyltransferase [Calditrichota bacterium]
SAALECAGITVNKNMVPNDPQKPFVTSGVRIGTPALTTRGMKEDEMRTIGRIIAEVLENLADDALIARAAAKTSELSGRFPLYEYP